MKKLLILTIVLMVLVVLVGCGEQIPQNKTTEKPPPAEVKESTPPAAPGTSSRLAPQKQMTGKVLQVNATANTFTVISQGKEITFSAAKLKTLPKIDEIVDITYTDNPGGPMEATNLNSSRSNIY